MEFHKKKKKKTHLKYNKLIGQAYAYYFSKIYTVYYRIRQVNTKFTVSFPGKQYLSSKIFQILPGLVILKSIQLNGWQVCCLEFNGSLGNPVKYQAVTQKEGEKGKE